MKEIKLSVEQKQNITIFTNETDMGLIISYIPVKPKRKYTDIMFVKPNEFIIYDNPLDLTQVSFRFVYK